MKKKLLSLVITGVYMGAMPSVFAAENAGILKRLDQLEAQRKADQAEINALREQVQKLEQKNPATATGISSAEAAELREEIVSVDKKANSRVDSVKHSIETERDKLKVNGYMSVYATKSTDSAVTNNTGIDNHVGFKSDTVAGIQFDYKVNSKIDAVIQLQGAGSEEYQVETNWAFLRYNLSPSTKIRAGRMVAPLYLYADSIDVGYTYPWVRPPVEMYGSEPVHYQGIDLLQNFNIGQWNNTAQFLYGDIDSSDDEDGNITSDYIAGIVLTLNNDAWTIRSSYNYVDNVHVSAFDADELTPLGIGRGSIGYLAGAVRYDDGGLFALVEGKQIRSTGDLNKGLPTIDGFYTTLGYQIDAFFPYATWAKSYSKEDGNVALPTFLQTQESIGLGLRYNLTDKVVLKGEATKYDHFDGTAGILGFVSREALRADSAGVLNNLDEDGVTLMSFGFDAIY